MTQSNHSDVEVIVIHDPWAEFGTPLPEHPIFPDVKPTHVLFKRLRVWSIAALLTVTLHSLLLGSLLLGTPSRKQQTPMTEGAATSVQNNNAAEFVSTLVSIQDHSITAAETQDDSAYSVLKQAEHDVQKETEFAILTGTPQLEVQGTADGTDVNAVTAEASGDAAGRAMLFGRYMGQVKARIERAWIKPSTATFVSFQCKVQIKQSKQGDVQEVTLQRCGNDSAWQLSLVKAIQSASPLSAPPDESVFTELLTLNFNADAK